jgi:putative peptidoglycan lipid II flippase
MGLVRQKIFAHYFGSSDAGDAFYAALKIPNFLQNLLGDGVLSASFIPVYANLVGRGGLEEADRVAGVIGSLLALVNGTLVAVGIWATPLMIDVIAPGFHGEKRELTIRLVQIFFPGTGFLVMSAWCLGILNSHRRFFLSYVAPVIWNIAIIAALLYFGRTYSQDRLAVAVAWSVFVGSVLQFGVQLPSVLRCAPYLKAGLNHRLEPVRMIFRNFLPVLVSRGVVQVSAYVDSVFASLLPMGAVSALAYTQSIYMLPISLFGMSVSASELSAMSRAQGTVEEKSIILRGRIQAGLRQIAFFIVPSVVAMLALGDIIVAGLFQGGEFHQNDSIYVWGVLAGSTVGLLATTLGRLYSSAFYSLGDTRTPLRFATIRVALTIALGYLFGLRMPIWFGIDRSWGTAGLTLSAGLAGWIEFFLLRRAIGTRLAADNLSPKYLAKLWGAGIVAGALGWGLKSVVGHAHPVLDLGLICIPFGVVYFAITAAIGIDESRRLLRKIAARLKVQ